MPEKQRRDSLSEVIRTPEDAKRFMDELNMLCNNSKKIEPFDVLSIRIKLSIRDVPDFPKPGINFKDITPLLKNSNLCENIIDALAEKLTSEKIDAIAGLESRGFLFGLPLAIKLGVPFIPIRKAGKLPFDRVQKKYNLEYGEAIIEMHSDAFEPGQKIHIHDDLLATGGTSVAAGELIQEMGGIVAGYSFIVSIPLKGREVISKITDNVLVLAEY